MSQFSITLDRPDVSVSDFIEALESQVRVVREVMLEMGIPAQHVRWVVENLKGGSASAVIRAQPLDKSVIMADVSRAVRYAGEGVSQLANSKKRPPYFNDEALKASRALMQIMLQHNERKSQLQFGETKVKPAANLLANVAEIVRGDLPSIGSLEGTLVGIRGADGSYRISVRDRIRNRDVRCNISPKDLKRALAAFEERVIVRGRVWSRSDGSPDRIDVRTLEVLPPDDELPSRHDVRGILSNLRLADGE